MSGLTCSRRYSETLELSWPAQRTVFTGPSASICSVSGSLSVMVPFLSPRDVRD